MYLEKIGLIYGSDTGNTEEVGRKIATAIKALGYKVELIDVASADIGTFLKYRFLILGIPTWDFGGIQDDWEEMGEDISTVDLSDKIIALYGLGDQRGYGDYFVDAMGWLRNHIQAAGAQVIGYWPTDGYKFSASLACNEEMTEFCGLAIDEDQQFELTDKRISQWSEQIISELEVILITEELV